MRYLMLMVTGLAVAMSLASCQKTEKTSTAGGGASSQSLMTVKGAAR